VFADRTSQRRTLEVEARLVHLEELEQLALGLAHEIRNPLASLRGAAVELASGTLPPQQAERMEAIVLRESDRLDRTVDDFLEYSRSRRVEHSEAVNLAEVVEEVIESVSGRQDARDVQMTRQCQQGAVILGDRDGLHQVVSNLTINALEAGAQKIGFVIALQGDHLRLEISDDGSGMTPELQSRAFLPFVSTKTREGGLGLALVKKIVDSAAGWIEVESLQGEGTTFLITLPVAVSVPQKVGAR
jgi:signal transduction histidine kinase